MHIVVDIMGSDQAPDVLFQGVLLAAEHLASEAYFHVTALPELIEEIKSSHRTSKSMSRVRFVPVPEFIKMDDSPLYALRRKKQASVNVGLSLVKEKKAQAFVSAGNTGALIMGARMHLPSLPDIERPALLAIMPTQKDHMVVVDVGGNVSYDTHHLVQFALMGAAFHRCSFGTKPKVGLLNIGIESKKGTVQHRDAYLILEELSKKNASFQFMGNIEGKEAFQGKVDVLVTDGFTGNVFLKTSEGASSFFMDTLKKIYTRHKEELPRSVAQDLQHRLASDEYPGAALCGIEGVVIKCHGDSSAKAMFQGIKSAAGLIRHKLVAKIKSELKNLPTISRKKTIN